MTPKRLYALLSLSPLFWAFFFGPFELIFPDYFRNSNWLMYVVTGINIVFLILIPVSILLALRLVWKTRSNFLLLAFAIANALLLLLHLVMTMLLIMGISEH